MDQPYDVLSDKIDDMSEKLDGISAIVTDLQVKGGDGTIKLRLDTAEREIGLLFDRDREMEKAVSGIRDQVSSKISFWRGVAWIAGVAGGFALLVVDIALRLF